MLGRLQALPLHNVLTELTMSSQVHVANCIRIVHLGSGFSQYSHLCQVTIPLDICGSASTAVASLLHAQHLFVTVPPTPDPTSLTNLRGDDAGWSLLRQVRASRWHIKAVLLNASCKAYRQGLATSCMCEL